MNTLLGLAEAWFAGLEIKTIARPTCLMVNKADVEKFGTHGDVLAELRTGIGSTKVFWSNKDDNYLYLESF